MDYPFATCSRRKLNRWPSLTLAQHIYIFLLYILTGRKHFLSERLKGKKNCSWCVKNNNNRWSVLPGGLHFKGLCHVFKAGNLRPRSIAAIPHPPLCRSGGDSVYIPPIHLCVTTRYLQPAPCVPVSRAFNRISASTPVSGLKHFEMHFLHWTGFLLGRGERFPINNVLHYPCNLIRM